MVSPSERPPNSCDMVLLDAPFVVAHAISDRRILRGKTSRCVLFLGTLFRIYVLRTFVGRNGDLGRISCHGSRPRIISILRIMSTLMDEILHTFRTPDRP